MEPGQAFGTGAHATTRLCLEMLVEGVVRAATRMDPLTDLGTGSGVLAICDRELGWAPVMGWDHEHAALEAATANAAVNGVELDPASASTCATSCRHVRGRWWRT